VVIPEKSDQIAHRAKKGSRGGRPPSFDAGMYRDRNVVERAFNRLKGWRGVATCTTSTPVAAAQASSAPASSCSGRPRRPVHQTT